MTEKQNKKNIQIKIACFLLVRANDWKLESCPARREKYTLLTEFDDW